MKKEIINITHGVHKTFVVDHPVIKFFILINIFLADNLYVNNYNIVA